VSASRTDAPLYVARYRARQGQAPAEAGDAPAYARQALERAPAYVEAEGQRFTLEWAENTRTREIIPPLEWRERQTDVIDVHLVRHGETQGYSADGGLTPLGRWQAHRKGDELARAVNRGQVVRIFHAPTARAAETAEHLALGLRQGLRRFGRENEVGAPEPKAEFRNLQCQTPTGAQDPTQAFREYHSALERYEANKHGERPGWLVELDRFWRLQDGRGDPIQHWLSVPMLFFEPPGLVVRRMWQGIRQVAGGSEHGHFFVATHSGPMRALAAAALGHDPGEPYNAETIRIRLRPDLASALVTFRNKTADVDIRDLPDWRET
jgi:broad specificity phosphatase PhoE